MLSELNSGLLGPALVQMRGLDVQTAGRRLILLAGYSATLFVAWFLTRAVYNIWFHPLSRFPGPRYAATTDLVHYAMLARGDQVSWLLGLHKKYGDVVRVAPWRLSYTDPRAWRDIYGHRVGGRAAMPKDPEFYGGPLDVGGEASVFTEMDDVRHGRVRRIFSNAFSEKALRSQQGLMATYVDRLVSLVRQQTAGGQAVDAVKVYNFTTFDIMGDLTLGDHLGMLENGSYMPWVAKIFGTIRAVAVVSLMLRWRRLARLVRLVAPTWGQRALAEHNGFVIDRVDARLARGSEKPDIWNLLDRKGGEEVLSRSAMYSNASIFMMAGTETLATTMSGATWLLLRHPDKMRKLQDEIRALPSEDALNLDSLPQLQYLQACIDETLRVYPAVPVGGPRVVPEGGANICGSYLPGGTGIYIPQLPAYMSEKSFRNAKSFVPERWLPGTGYDSDRKEAFQPFSFGPRNCLGKNLAYHELRLMLAKMIWHFDLELCPESENWAVGQKVWNVWEKGPLMIKASPVDREVQ